jgi:Flp pilus assembly protein TadD
MRILASILAALLLPGMALAADTGPGATPEPKDAVLEQVGAATARQDWTGAADVLRQAVAASPGNADYHNLYAYSMRKGANPDMSLVFKHYNEALRIEPKHRGAHEYIGEAYLMVGNVAKAREHLGQLDRLCFFGCTEYTDLKKAIAEYEKKR